MSCITLDEAKTGPEQNWGGVQQKKRLGVWVSNSCRLIGSDHRFRRWGSLRGKESGRVVVVVSPSFLSGFFNLFLLMGDSWGVVCMCCNSLKCSINFLLPLLLPFLFTM